MQVAVFANPSTTIPYLCVLSAGQDTLQEAVDKYLVPFGIPYYITTDDQIPESPYIGNSQTVTFSGGVPQYDWDLDAAKTQATNYNTSYWQTQYNAGILSLGYTASYQLNLAIATPEGERTDSQAAVVEFLTGVNQLQGEIQTQIDAATTGTQLINILNQLG